MAKAIRVCKICGKEYPYCKTFRQIKFRWQDVACCPEHGFEYFRQIMESRGKNTEELYGAFPQFTASNQADEVSEPEQDVDDELDFEDEPQEE